MSGAHILSDTARGFEGLYNLIWFTNTGYLDTTRVHRRSNGTIRELEQMPDGRFLCNTNGNTYEGQPVSWVFRIEPDGVLDPDFYAPLVSNGGYRYAYDMEGLMDGRILIGGQFGLASTSDTVGVVRLLNDGSLDPTFDPVSISTADAGTPWEFPSVLDVLPMSDGRMIITGNFDRVRGVPRGGIAMINADGSLNEEYFVGAACGDWDGVNYRYIAGIVPAPDGSYYIHGSYWGYDDGTTEYPSQRFVSRLHGLSVGTPENQPARMQVYPNPTSGNATIEVERNIPNGVIVLRDALGREILRKVMSGYSNTIDLGSTPAGIYVLELFSMSERIALQRLVIE